jgi:hypothetical protein
VTERRPEGDGDLDDPLRSMRAERVERDDGRYLVYFSWDAPEPDPERRREAAVEPSRAPSADDVTSPGPDTRRER